MGFYRKEKMRKESAYRYTRKYVAFLEGAERMFRKIIKKTKIDDLCGEMLDYYTDANINEMKISGREQYISNIKDIADEKRLSEGECIKGRGYLAYLDEDLRYLNEQIAFYQQLKRDRKVY